MFFIDIAVPRDIDPEINELHGTFCYDIDDLQSIVSQNQHERKKQSIKAEGIIEEEISSASVIEHLLLEGESGGRILYDAGQATSGLHSFDRSDRILLEQGDGDIILLDGIDSDSTDAGRALLFESIDYYLHIPLDPHLVDSR